MRYAPRAHSCLTTADGPAAFLRKSTRRLNGPVVVAGTRNTHAAMSTAAPATIPAARLAFSERHVDPMTATVLKTPATSALLDPDAHNPNQTMRNSARRSGSAPARRPVCP